MEIGDVVVVQDGVLHPGLQVSLAGWQGRVVDVVQADGELYLAVQWDSMTLQAMPPGMAQFMVDMDWEWRGWIFAPYQLVATAVRDTITATETAAAAIAAQLDGEITPWNIAEILLDAEDEEAEAFDPELFLAVLQIPEYDHTAVHDALAAGAGVYYWAQVGKWRYGKRPSFLIPILMAKAPIFGYGVLEILADEAISLDSRKKIAYFACQTADPFARDHMPHGLITFISFLAVHDALSLDLFRGVLVALALGGSADKLAGWSAEWALGLTEWLLSHKAIPDTEKQWWLWYLAAHMPPTIGRALLPVWAAHEGLPPDLRSELLWGWLMNEEQVGQPPANWRLMAATFAGDMETAEAIAAEMKLAEALSVDETAVLADLANTPHIPPMPDHHGPGNDPVGFLTMLMGMTFGAPPLPPAFVRRFAVGALAELEGNPLELFQMLLAEADALNEELRHGVLDALPRFADGFTANQKRQLLHMGLIVSKAAVRQRLYELGVTWFGDEYVQEALTDPAKSIRDWAEETKNRKQKTGNG